MALSLLVALGCGEDPPGDDLRDLVLVEVSGDSQDVAPLGSSAPIVVQVLDTEGDTVPGTIVQFAVTVGAGTVTAVDTADEDGFAGTAYTATTTSGLRTVRARVPGSDLFFTVAVGAGSPATITSSSGNEQGANVSTALATPLGARVADAWGNGVAGVPVIWTIVNGGGTLSDDTTLTNAGGIATVERTLGPGVGGQVVAAVTPAVADTVQFHATGKKAMTVLAGGNNVPQHYTSDLWVRGNYGYTGTWGSRGSGSHLLKVWDVSSGVALIDTISVGVGTLSDSEVSPDGTLLLSTSEGGGGANGLYIHSLTDPAHPAPLAFEAVGAGLHTGTFAEIGGALYVFASKDPQGGPSLMGFRIQPDSTDKIVTLFSLPQGGLAMHDQFYRDGLLFASVWDNGLKIYDVGDGRAGGTPGAPQLVGSIVTGSAGLSCHCVHNAWWYHDTTGAKRYVFVGQEGPGTVGSSSSGDIHVVDVSNMAAPEEVAFYHHPENAGVHNFWMDETRGILYAAYYNGGVVALDVTGELAGNLAGREISRIKPAGASTYVWGVMLANGALWASDMLTGFWKLSPP